jgi:hypothetical protein
MHEHLFIFKKVAKWKLSETSNKYEETNKFPSGKLSLTTTVMWTGEIA